MAADVTLAMYLGACCPVDGNSEEREDVKCAAVVQPLELILALLFLCPMVLPFSPASSPCAWRPETRIP